MDRLLTIDQLSEVLQVDKKTIYQWRYKSLIPYLLIKLALFTELGDDNNKKKQESPA